MKDVKMRFSMIFTKEQLERINTREIKGGITEVTADVHGLSVKNAKKFINNIINVARTAIKLVIIHGYNHGTAIKDMIRETFDNSHVVGKYDCSYNKGVTFIYTTI
jgi:DNA-nicking Smr family endonuclease